jgi:hypothetical protein
MENAQKIVNIVLKAVAVGAGVSSIVLAIVGVVEIEAQVTMLSIGLATLSIASLSETGAQV